MKPHKYTFQELKCTAMVYATRTSVVEHVRHTGLLPEEIDPGGFHIIANRLMEKRGTDPDLTKDEIMVLKAIIKTGSLPGGGVILINQANSDESGEDEDNETGQVDE